jgi:hypothetical protein
MKVDREVRKGDPSQLWQSMANLQNEAERCYAMQLNKYIDSVQGLGKRYNHCKEHCLELDPDLAKELQRRIDNQGQSNEYFSPIYTNRCLTDCRSQFYFTFKRVSRYFGKTGEDRGFYVESCVE